MSSSYWSASFGRLTTQSLPISKCSSRQFCGSLAFSSWRLKPLKPSIFRTWTGRGRSQNCFLHITSLQRTVQSSNHASKPAVLEIQTHSPALEKYSPPTTGIISKLPLSWVPYAELIRIDKPTGAYYLYFPCLFSTLLAAPLAVPMASPLAVLGYSALFFAGAIVMRGAGCTINDLWDRNLDPHVRRTKFRPIARGALTPRQAFIFLGFQLMTGLGILLSFPPSCLLYGIPSLVFVTVYPLAKRVTYYPQFVLGLTFSWGAIMGPPALGIDLIHDPVALKACMLLYSSNVAWTILYDMIYAHMDIKDDAKAGIKSIALKHDAETKMVLTGLAILQIGLLAAAGLVTGAGPAFYFGSCVGGMVTLVIMIKRVNLKSVVNCWWWFVNGCLITGGTVSLGLSVDYILRWWNRVEAKET